MGTLYESIMSLCREKGIKGGKMCVDLGLSKGIMTNLKQGRRKSISTETAQKIADYFGVSVGRVLGIETESDAPTAVHEQELDEELVKSLMGLSPTEVKKALIFIEGLKAARD